MRNKWNVVAVGALLLMAASALWPSRTEAATVLPLPGSDPRPLAETLEELGRLYGVFFTYDASLVADATVSFEPIAGEELEAAVNRLLVQTDLGYEAFDDKYFVLFRDSKQGRREAGRLRRKVRQLTKLEQEGRYAGLIRSDGDPSGTLQKVNEQAADLTSAMAVSGTVSGENGETLPGVAVRIIGTDRGTLTDASGQFNLPLRERNQTLEFTYLGYAARRQLVRAGERLNVELKPGETELPEVLVVGYGSIDASAVTSSIVRITPGALPVGQTVDSPHQWLQGMVAGVQVLGGNGEQGSFQSIRIRGGTSMNASNEPLVVVDGVPVDNDPHVPNGLQPGRNPLNTLNPADIASVTVLKDAAAGAIYGSRAANGVVLIETRQSRLYQQGQLSYDSWVSVARPAGRLEVLDGPAYRELVGSIAPWRLDELGTANTDWQATIVAPAATSQQHTLSYSAGGQQAGYRVSLGYLGRGSVSLGAGSRRLSAALNGRQELWNHQLKLSADVKLARVTDRYLSPSLFSYAYAFDPTQPVYDAASPWGGYFEYQNDLTIKNPLAEAEQVIDEGRVARTLGHVKAVYEPAGIPGLRGTLLLGYDHNQGRRNLYAPATVRYQYVNQGEYRLAWENRRSRLWESYLNYDRRLNSDRLGLALTAGYTYQHGQANYPEEGYFGIEAYDYAFGAVPASNQTSQTERFRENRLASFFGRSSFDWQRRYFLTTSLRADGSSRFSPDNRWAFFPAASAAWRISEEPFLASRPGWLESLKLRAGWGITGNQEIGDYQYLPTFTRGGNEVRFPFGGEYLITARPNAVSPSLKWEQTSSFNLAMEASFLAGRLNTTLEAYHSVTRDLLSQVIVPAGSNLSDIVLTNVGSIRNRGLELSLAYKSSEKQNFSYSLGLNLATNKNEVLSLGPGPDRNFRAISTGTISGGTGNTIQIYREGEALNTFYVFAHKKDAAGRPLVDGVDHNLNGRIDLADMYEDTNQDGVVNDRDKRPYHQPAPRVFGGLQLSLNYREWGLHASLRGQSGNYVYNNLAAISESYNRILLEPELLNVPVSLLTTGFQTPQLFSDYYVENASFLRMDGLTLDYTTSMKKDWLNSLRVYLTLQNVFTLTAYRGLDPEIGNASGNPGVPRYGIDDLVFPRTRTILAGLNALF